MEKGDQMTGVVESVKPVKTTKKGKDFTPINLAGDWLCLWGSFGDELKGRRLTCEISWVAPDSGAVFGTITDSATVQEPRPRAHEQEKLVLADNPAEIRDVVKLRAILMEALELAARIEANTADDPPSGSNLPF